MRKIQQDIRDIEKEIEDVKSRDDIEIETFHKIIKRRKEIWNAYFLDCLEKEKATFEYINQQIDSDVTVNFQKLMSKINDLNKEVEKLKEDRKVLITPMEFEKLVEWTKEEDVLSDLFVMPVKISDIKILLNNVFEKELDKRINLVIKKYKPTLKDSTWEGVKETIMEADDAYVGEGVA